MNQLTFPVSIKINVSDSFYLFVKLWETVFLNKTNINWGNKHKQIVWNTFFIIRHSHKNLSLQTEMTLIFFHSDAFVNVFCRTKDKEFSISLFCGE